ncbi:putative Thioredoxin superfamily protein [Hibiscus syriacus]|uniref:Thioredoxin superfamily protein n=1 Tax=Hibiscus syriacus TaxID=106335 RepID=A0A6A3CFC4_HIBSY|nr:putative Thioredoxin superfamily protein [Hibiscus syriacus]
MASSGFNAQQIILSVAIAASLLTLTQAATVIVGGSENWRYGYNYTEWAANTAPFCFQDTLVFKYDNTTAHSVYMLPNLWSYLQCDFSKAKLLANTTQGEGDGFRFVLNQWRVFYLASGEANDCKDGQMKLVVVPWPRSARVNAVNTSSSSFGLYLPFSSPPLPCRVPMILHGIIGPPRKQPSNGGPPVTVHTMSGQDSLVLGFRKRTVLHIRAELATPSKPARLPVPDRPLM